MATHSGTGLPPILRLGGSARAAVRAPSHSSIKRPPIELTIPHISFAAQEISLGPAEVTKQGSQVKRLPRHKRGRRRF